jgi:hypothetical protein
MKDKFRTTKLWDKTIRSLKIISAISNKSMAEMAEDLVSSKFNALKQKNLSVKHGNDTDGSRKTGV